MTFAAVPLLLLAAAALAAWLPLASVRTLDRIAQEARAGMGFTLTLLGIAAPWDSSLAPSVSTG